MGTWGTGPFDNDESSDFLDALLDADTDKFDEIVSECIVGPAEAHGAIADYIYDVYLITLAAVIVAQNNDEQIEYFEENEEELPPIVYTDDDLQGLIDKLEDIFKNSDKHYLYELWAEAAPDDFAAWQASLNELLSALRASL